jgi:NhaA family Na+:H+ antiporter
MSFERRTLIGRVIDPLRDFLSTEASGGILLVGASVAALVWANSPWKSSYTRLWGHHLHLRFAGHGIDLSLQHWVNDGLMTIFFLVVGLEIKREMTSGHLAGRRAATLPVLAALGGMVVPALLYLAVAGRTASHGWGVPMATDIALAVGVLALAGPAVPPGLRALLLGLAVVDDIGAIVVIAVFYSTGVSFGWLAAAFVAVGAAALVRVFGVHHVVVFVVLGIIAWYGLHRAGVHPTIAGVAMGLLAPVTPRHRRAPTRPDSPTSPTEPATDETSEETTVEWLEHVLHPWSSFVIVPIFALSNAGIEVTSASLRAARGSAITWGIIAGLLLGKPLGVVLATRLTVRAGLADAPATTTSRQLLGAGNAAGIGFTVALFIAELAFRDSNGIVDPVAVADAKMAILAASLVSGGVAFAVLRQRRVAPTKLS